MAELRRHDHAHATDYGATLRARVEAQGDPVEAGAAVGSARQHRSLPAAHDGRNHQPLHVARKRLAMMIELAATATD